MAQVNTSPGEPAFRPFGSRWWRRFLVCLGALAALAGAFYAEEDWRGHRDWGLYRQAAEARGEPLEFRAYIPKLVPDEENFAEAPVVKTWLQLDLDPIFTNDFYARADYHVYPTNSTKSTGHRHFADLVAWQMAFSALQTGELQPDQHFATDKMDPQSRAEAAPAVLEGLKSDEPVFTALRLASARKYSRFPLQYDREDPALILMAHHAKIRVVCERLSLQVCAELAAGQTDKALADEKLMLYLADAIKEEPFLISFLVRDGWFQVAIPPVREGLAEHRWTELQLKELQSSFQHDNFLADADQSLKAERAYQLQEMEQVKKQGLGYLYVNLAVKDAFGQLSRILNLFGRIMPAGWMDQERLNYCTLFDLQLKGAMDLAEGRVFPRQIALNEAELNRKLPPGASLSAFVRSVLHHQVIADGRVEVLGKLPGIAATLQTTANQTAIACALEMYRLANGHFPETLSVLTPQFMSRLPNDVITGQPYKYRLTGDGQFILYSVGWNEKDDGGVPGKRRFDDQEGDWVWDYTAS